MWRELRDKLYGKHVHSPDPTIFMWVAAHSGEPKKTCWKEGCRYRLYGGEWHKPFDYPRPTPAQVADLSAKLKHKVKPITYH